MSELNANQIAVLDSLRDLTLGERREVLEAILVNWCFHEGPVRPCPEEHDGSVECGRCGDTGEIDGLPCGHRIDEEGDCEVEHP